MLSETKKERYNRHILLPEVGEGGQRKLLSSSVVVVGAGGLGSPLLLYLAAAGVGRLTIIDHDRVELSNLQRQILYQVDDVGEPKAQAARGRLLRLNPDLDIRALAVRLREENSLDLLQGHDVIVAATDSFQTRYLINDATILLQKPLVHGAIRRFDGQVTVFNLNGGPCLRCLYPSPPPEETSSYARGLLGPLPGVVGAIMAAEVLKILLGVGDPLSGKLLLYDMLETQFRSFEVRKNPLCPVCAKS